MIRVLAYFPCEGNSRDWLLYPLLNDKIPSLSAQCITDEEFDEVEWEVEDNVVQPYHSSPTPSNTFYRSEAPVCIDCDQGSDLRAKIMVKLEKGRNKLERYEMNQERGESWLTS